MVLVWLLAPVVAVLPFRDLGASPTSPAVGEALRVTLERDLAAVKGLTVVERAALERGLAELGAGAGAADPDRLGARKLSRGTGATVLVVGAYEPRDGRVKVWLRFLWAASGKVAGTVTDGAAGEELLALVGRTSTELARTVGVDKAEVARLASRKPEPLHGWKSVERYGQALLEKDDEKRRLLLQLLLDEDPTFAHAAHDLEALELRLPRPASAEHERVAREALVRARKKLAEEKDPLRISEQYLGLFADLQRQRRYRLLIAEASAVVAHPPPPVPTLSEQLPESAQLMIVAAWDQLNDEDAVVREGQRFIAKYPLSNGFPVVRQLVDQALDHKKQREAGARKVKEAVAQLPDAERADPCRVAEVYADYRQLAEARSRYADCLKTPGAHDLDRIKLLWVSHRLGDFAAVREHLETLRKIAPARHKQVMHLADELPVD